MYLCHVPICLPLWQVFNDDLSHSIFIFGLSLPKYLIFLITVLLESISFSSKFFDFLIKLALEEWSTHRMCSVHFLTLIFCKNKQTNKYYYIAHYHTLFSGDKLLGGPVSSIKLGTMISSELTTVLMFKDNSSLS